MAKKTYQALAKIDGALDMTEYQRKDLRQFIKDNTGKRLRLVIDMLTPESRKQRAFYHGAVLCLWAYLDGNNYRSAEVMSHYHEVAKRQFNPGVIMIHGVPEMVGMSSKGELNDGYIEKIIDYLEDNYGIVPAKVLNPEHYKYFRDKIYGFGKYETYIEYMKDEGLLQ